MDPRDKPEDDGKGGREFERERPAEGTEMNQEVLNIFNQAPVAPTFDQIRIALA